MSKVTTNKRPLNFIKIFVMYLLDISLVNDIMPCEFSHI
jgi:hypothetical protein